jgi:hypothetical protein
VCRYREDGDPKILSAPTIPEGTPGEVNMEAIAELLVEGVLTDDEKVSLNTAKLQAEEGEGEMR